jgi:hypothetical protein
MKPKPSRIIPTRLHLHSTRATPRKKQIVPLMRSGRVKRLIVLFNPIEKYNPQRKRVFPEKGGQRTISSKEESDETDSDHSRVKHHENPDRDKAQAEADESDPDLLAIFEDHHRTRMPHCATKATAEFQKC